MALESFNAYHSYLDAMEELNDAERGRLFTALLIYSSTGEAPELRGNERFVFPSMKSQIDRDIGKYKRKCEKNRANGEKANGSDRQRTGANGTDRPPNAPQGQGQGQGQGQPSNEGDKSAKTRHAHGQYGWVKLTDDEYARLLADFGETELARCIAYVDESAQATGNKNRWKDWNLTVRKCHRDGWGLDRRKPGKVTTAAEYSTRDRSGERTAFQSLDGLLDRI